MEQIPAPAPDAEASGLSKSARKRKRLMARAAAQAIAAAAPAGDKLAPAASPSKPPRNTEGKPPAKPARLQRGQRVGRPAGQHTAKQGKNSKDNGKKRGTKAEPPATTTSGGAQPDMESVGQGQAAKSGAAKGKGKAKKAETQREKRPKGQDSSRTVDNAPGPGKPTRTPQVKRTGNSQPGAPAAKQTQLSKIGSIEFALQTTVPSHLRTAVSTEMAGLGVLSFGGGFKSNHPVLATQRHVLEAIAAELISGKRVLMPGARSSLKRLLEMRGLDPATVIHVCQPELDGEDSRYLNTYYGQMVSGSLAVTVCDHKVEDCDCMADPEVVYLTNVVYYLDQPFFRKYARMGVRVLSIHHDYHHAEGCFPAPADVRAYCLKKDKDGEVVEATNHPWKTEQTWRPLPDGRLEVTIDDGAVHRHPNVEDIFARCDVTASAVYSFKTKHQTTRLAWLNQGPVVHAVPVPSAADEQARCVLLTGNRDPARVAAGLARTGVPSSVAVASVLDAMSWAEWHRTQLSARYWLVQNRYLVGGLAAAVGLIAWRVGPVRLYHAYKGNWRQFLGFAPASVVTGRRVQDAVEGLAGHLTGVVNSQQFHEAKSALAKVAGSALETGSQKLLDALDAFPHGDIVNQEAYQAFPDRLTQQRASILDTVVFAPIIEETLVRPYVGTAGLILLEQIRPLSLPQRLYVGAVHLALGQIGNTKLRILAHSAHNILTLMVPTPNTATGSLSLLGIALALAAGGWLWRSRNETRAPCVLTMQDAADAIESGDLVEGDVVEDVCVGYDATQHLPLTETVEIKRIANPQPCEALPTLQLVGPYVAGAPPPFVFRSCDHNKLAALYKRCFQPYEWETEGSCDQIVRAYSKGLADLETQLPLPSAPELSSEWARKFTSSKAAMLRGDHTESATIRREYGMFVKRERQVCPLDTPYAFNDSTFCLGPTVKFDPRCIWVPKPGTRWATGPGGTAYSHTVSDMLEATVSRSTRMRFCYPCGANTQVLGQKFDDAYWFVLRTGDPFAFVFGDDILLLVRLGHTIVFIMADASRQDHYMLRDMKLLNFDWAARAMRYRTRGSYLHWFWTFNRANHGTGLVLKDRVMSAIAEHGQSSGDPTTSGNSTTVSAVVAVAAFQAWLATTEVSQMPSQIYGIPMKFQITEDIEQADFLNRLFYPALDIEGNPTTRPGPKLGRVVGKTFWHVGRLRERKARRWLKGLCTGLRLDVAHIPVLSTLINRLLYITADLEAWTDVTQPAWDLTVRADSPAQMSACCWDFMARRYGLDVDSLLEMDREAANAELGRPLHHPGWLITIQKDAL